MTKKQSKNKAIVIIEGKQIRRHWDEKRELWYFAVSDVIAVLTKSANPAAYWRKLKERLSKESVNETVTKCHGLKMLAPDGKMRLTDTADTETMLRAPLNPIYVISQSRAVQVLAGARGL